MLTTSRRLRALLLACSVLVASLATTALAAEPAVAAPGEQTLADAHGHSWIIDGDRQWGPGELAAHVTSRVGPGGPIASVAVELAGPSSGYTLDLGAPTGEALQVAPYLDGGDLPRSPGEGRFSLSGEGRGCSREVASFKVLELREDGVGGQLHLAVHYAMSCDGGGPLVGDVRVASAVPMPAATPDVGRAWISGVPGAWVVADDRVWDADDTIVAYVAERAADGVIGSPSEVVVQFGGAAGGFRMEVGAPPGAPLQLGTTTGAQRAFGGSAPRFELTGEARGCNMVSASFTVDELLEDEPSGRLHLAMSFSMLCDGGGPILGELRYNSATPLGPIPPRDRGPGGSPFPPATVTGLDRLSIDFGDSRIGTYEDVQVATLTNRDAEPLLLDGLSIEGAAPLDFVGATECPASLGAGQSCRTAIVFVPTTTGARAAQLVVHASGGDRFVVQLSGTGTLGYRLVTTRGTTASFGDAGAGAVDAVGDDLVVGMATTPEGDGWWTVTRSGVVREHGTAGWRGDLRGTPLTLPIVGMAATPTGDGYWLVGRDGGIFAFGDAAFHGSTGAVRLNQPIVGMAATPTGEGYWFVAADGGIFSFGDAAFFGSTGAVRLNRPIVGMATTPTGQGYWMVADDGGIFTFGDAGFFGSTGAVKLNRPIVGMAATPTGQGYWFVADDGGMFTFGDAPFQGSGASLGLSGVVGVGGTAPPYVPAPVEGASVAAQAVSRDVEPVPSTPSLQVAPSSGARVGATRGVRLAGRS